MKENIQEKMIENKTPRADIYVTLSLDYYICGLLYVHNYLSVVKQFYYSFNCNYSCKIYFTYKYAIKF